MADANKVRFGLNKVHIAVITGYDDDDLPIYDTPFRLPGAVSLSMDASGEPSSFYADNGVYYVISNNAGYEGELEIALVTTEFATKILGEIQDAADGVLVETTNAEVTHFAMMFEFEGDKKKIRHVFYDCTATRTAVEGDTIEDETEVKTETLSLTASALANGVVKARTCENTTDDVFDAWYDAVYATPVAADYDGTAS